MAVKEKPHVRTWKQVARAYTKRHPTDRITRRQAFEIGAVAMRKLQEALAEIQQQRQAKR